MRFLRRLVYWWRAGRADEEFSEELEFHRARIQANLERDGLPAAEAAAASRRAMGNVTLAREDARQIWIAHLLDSIWRDAKYAARGLARDRAFTATAVLALALGMAMATTAFSVVDAEIWKPLPFPSPWRLVEVFPRGPGSGGAVERVSGADVLDWRAQSQAFSGLAAMTDTQRRILHRQAAESALVMGVTSNFFDVLGSETLVGRAFEPADERGAQAAMLSERGWRRLFDADPNVIGRTLTLDDQHLVVTGVTRGALEFVSDPDLFVVIDTGAAPFRDRATPIVNVIGRLRPGVDAAAAEEEMAAIGARIAQRLPAGRTDRTMHVQDLKTFNTGFNWRPLFFFLYAACLVLLLSCVNVAGLLLARGLRRAREFAVRRALGGGPRALVRQLVVEGVVLAIPGGVLGLLLTTWALGILAGAMPQGYLIRVSSVPVDLRVCAAAFAVTALTGLVFGLTPAFFARRTDLAAALGQGSRTTGQSPAQRRTRHLLLAAEVALTVVLLAGAAIFLESFAALTRIPLGFEPRGAASLRVSLSGPRYSTDAQVRQYATDLMDRARAVPGVRDVAMASSSPFGSGPLVRFVRTDRPRPSAGEESRAIIRAVSPGYFEALGIRLMSGRAISADDRDVGPRVAVVNQAVARQIFPGEDPIGREIELVQARALWTDRPGRLLIVGVASNVREVGFNEIDFNDIYVPFAQLPAPVSELVVRTTLAGNAVLPALRAAAAGVDPDMPVSRLTMFGDRVDEALRGDRFNLLLVASFAVAALLLAAIGIFGAVAYAVQERRREFAVRMALGAQQRAVVVTALSQALRFAGAGGVFGVVLTLGLARMMGSALYMVPGEHEGLLYGVTTTDPLALAASVAGMFVVAGVAAFMPARHVARLDPLLALQAE